MIYDISDEYFFEQCPHIFLTCLHCFMFVVAYSLRQFDNRQREDTM